MVKMNCVVTTARDPIGEMTAMAQMAAAELKLPFVNRSACSMAEIAAKFQATELLLATRQGWALYTPGGKLVFHLNMAYLRIKNLRAGQIDHMAQAMQLTPGLTVLDCTLGLASDAIVASLITGAGGKVTGLETNPLIAFVVKAGLAQFTTDDKAIVAALQRIEVVEANYLEYLAAQPDNSYDIVYFDPMFRHPIVESVHLQPLRFIADQRAVTAETLIEAERVARRRIVFKENSRSDEFKRLGFTKIVGGKYSSVHYGVKEINE